MMLVMLPPRPSSIWLPNTCVMFQVPVRLVSITAFQPFGVKSRARCAKLAAGVVDQHVDRRRTLARTIVAERLDAWRGRGC